MTATKRAVHENANPGSEQSFGRNRTPVPEDCQKSPEQAFGQVRTVVRAVAAVIRTAQRLWPTKPAYELSFRTGVSLRAAEYWLAGDREMSVEAFVALLRSHEGFAFLEAVMTAVPSPARPAWWRKLQRSAAKAELKRRQAALAAEFAALDREEQLDLHLGLGGPRR